MSPALRSVGLGLLGLCFVAGCTDEPETPLTHGYVKIRFARLASEDSSPYVGTTEVSVVMRYGKCYTDFYATNPNYKQDGVEGALVFGTEQEGGEGWTDRICDGSEGGEADCSVIGFRQEFELASQLIVTYRIDGELENRLLKFGPLPTAELAMCPSPEVTLQANSIRGSDNGVQLWDVAEFNPAVATPGQGQAIVVSSQRN